MHRVIKAIYDGIHSDPELPPLPRALVDGDTVLLQSLLAAHADVNEQFKAGTSMFGQITTTALHLAAYKSSLDMVATLLQSGASVNKSDGFGWTPLHVTGNQEVAKLLLDKGADIMARVRDSDQFTPLHCTGNPDIAKLLLDKGADPMARDNFALFTFADSIFIFTPLHCTGNPDIAKLLLDKGADPMARDIYKHTPLHLTDNPDVAKLLLDKGADLMARDKKQQTPLHFTYNPDVAKLLLDKGADPMARDKKQRTPLHFTDDPDVAKMLLDQGADIMARDEREQTPMQTASIEYYLEALSVMLTHAASPTQTWVQKAVATAQVTEDSDVKKSILKYCADILSDPALNFKDINILEWSNCDLTDTILQDKLKHLPEDGRYFALFLNQNKISVFPNLKPFKQLQSLLYLSLSGNPLHSVQCLPTDLKGLYVYNTNVEVLSKGCFNENTFEVVKRALINASLYNYLKQPPKEVFDRGLDNVIRYFSKGHLLSNCRYRMVTVGDTGAGKTSLILAIISGEPYLTEESDRTHVMDLREWHINESDTFNLLDQGGHTVYDITNDYFIGRRCIILIVHDLSNPKTISRTLDIVRNTLHHHPENKIIMALSHIDKIDNVAKLSSEFQREIEDLLKGEIATFKSLLENPANKGFIDEKHVKDMLDHYQNKLSDIEYFLVSSKSYSGVEGLRSFLIQKISRQRVHIPMSWINCFSVMSDSNASFWSMSELLDVMKSRNESELVSCLRYLSDTGMVVWYEDHPTLQHYVFQNTEFLVSVMKSLFHHDLKSTLNYEEDSELRHRFTESELEDVLRKYEQEGILKHTFLQYLWKKYNLNPEHEKALIDLIKKFHIFSEIYTEQDEVHRTLYFVPWFVKENEPPKNVNIDNPLVINANLASLNIQCVFHNKIPLNVAEFLMVEIQKYAVEEGYLGKRYAWADGLQVNIDQTTITAFRNNKKSSISLIVTAEYKTLLEMWHSLGTLNDSLISILQSYHGSLRSYHSNCPHCQLFGFCPVHRWLQEQVFPKHPLKSLYVDCQRDGTRVPAALVTKMPEDEKLQKRLDTVRTYLQTCGKQPDRSMQIAIPQDTDVPYLSRQMAQLDSNISAQLAQQNWVLSEQIYRQNQQLSLQGQVHAQQNLAQNQMLSQHMYQVLSQQMDQQRLQLSGENQMLSQQMNQQRLQFSGENQMLSQQINQQQLELSGENQVLSQQMYQHQAQSSFENRVLSEQMYHQGKELYVQGQVHAQQSLDQNRQLTTQVVETGQQLSHQTQAQSRELVGHLQQNTEQLADVMRLEAGDASGITLNIQHPILKERQQLLEQHLQVDSELLNNMMFNDLISIEEKPKIEQDGNSSSRICRVLRLLEQNDKDKVKKFAASLCMCKRDGTNYMLGELIKQDMEGLNAT